MPDKWPLANGNWSNAANWNGGTLPIDGDDIFADNRAIVIDIDINLPTARLWTTARSGGTSGGSFTVNSARNITLATVTAGTSNGLTVTSSCNLTGITFQGAGTNISGLVISSGTGIITFSNCTASGGLTGSGAGVACDSPYTITGTLNLINALNSQGQAFYNRSASSVVTLTGNVQHGTGQTVWIQNFGSFTYVVLSETFVATSSGSSKISSSSNQTVIWDRGALGLLTVPTIHNIYVDMSGVGLFRYIGDLTPTAIQCTGTFEHVGRFIGRDSNGACQITTNSDGVFLFDQIEPNSVTGNLPFIQIRKVRPRNSSSLITLRNQANTGTQVLVDSTQVGDPPLQSNVRSGIVYNFGTLTGTCAVPAAESVAVGVPVDATTGTAVLTQAAVQAALIAGNIATRADVEDAGIL